jgi:flagellar basal-body rod protein FlgG
MSVQTLYTAATGMESMQKKLDVIANNLANVNTTGFKRSQANFEDLFYIHEKLPGSQDSNGIPTPTGISIGLGSQVSSTQLDFRQGGFRDTGKQLDLSIQGEGFFVVQDPTGEQRYTRAGNFAINANGEMVLGSASNGRRLDPNISIPIDSTDVVINPNGDVQYRQVGSIDYVNAGTIQLANFINPEGLLQLGENLYAATESSGPPQQANPGDPNLALGILRQGFLEASNVEPVYELIDLITTQRSFELNSQAVQVGDEILQLVSNLRRF